MIEEIMIFSDIVDDFLQVGTRSNHQGIFLLWFWIAVFFIFLHIVLIVVMEVSWKGVYVLQMWLIDDYD
jgi:hypothetical protein